MNPKKKKISDNIIESLMNDLKDVAEPTMVLPEYNSSISKSATNLEDEKTLHLADLKKEKKSEKVAPPQKQSFGAAKAPSHPSNPSQMSGVESQIQQVENLRMAQTRILDLEKHLEKLRQDNEQLSSVVDSSRTRVEDLQTKVLQLEKLKTDAKEQASVEINIYRDNLANKDFELSKAKMKVEELESRLQMDLKKIRVRERELENRLELLKAEKSALLRTKDETILDLKRQIDLLTSEAEGYKVKCVELNHKIETNNDQFARTVRALRLALTNLEASENTNTMTIAPLKKAE